MILKIICNQSTEKDVITILINRKNISLSIKKSI